MSKLREAIYKEIGMLCELEQAFNGNLPEHQKRIDNSTDAILDAVIAALPKKSYEEAAHGYVSGCNDMIDEVKSILEEAKESK